MSSSKFTYDQLVNIKDWCKNTFEVVNQLRINIDTQAELALMKEQVPLLTKRAQGHDISRLSAYES